MLVHACRIHDFGNVDRPAHMVYESIRLARPGRVHRLAVRRSIGHLGMDAAISARTQHRLCSPSEAGRLLRSRRLSPLRTAQGARSQIMAEP